MSQLILQPFRRFTYVIAHSLTLPLFLLRHSSFSNPSFAYIGEVTEMLENELCSFSILSFTSPTSQLILQPFHRFTHITTHSPALPSHHLRHSSFSNPYVASPTSHFILQPFFRFSYVTSSSFNSPGEPPMTRSTLMMMMMMMIV